MKTAKRYNLQNEFGELYCKDATTGDPLGFTDQGVPVALTLPMARSASAILVKRHRLRTVKIVPAAG